ncbi:class II aldolase/adducin family protein [Gracilibacillus sp. HCP3S3_G5_1]|uniref:class II aldolase/adducin family protein n=1 Tax=unclassified Gracilibacillus TaxID=2625209 RepID=UPI003F8894D0
MYQTKYYSDFEAKKWIVEIGKRVYQKNFVAANDGNISVRVGPDTIWTTPTGVSKGFMTPDMMVKMRLDGTIIAGNRKPSSEVKMHLRVYQESEETNAVVHAHPPMATSYAIAGINLEKPVSPEAVVLLGRVPVAPYATPSTEEVPDSITPLIKDHHAVLLANHGALTWGRDLFEAYYRMESLEHYALMLTYSTNILNKANELNCNQISDLIEIRNKMGIKTGGVPPCNVTEQKQSMDRTKEQVIQNIVEKVTKRVIEQLQKGGAL